MEVTIDRLIRSSRKTISLELTPGGELVVRAPRWLPRSAVQHAVDGKAAWVRQKKLLAAGREAQYPPKRYEEDEPFLLLGDRYPLRFDAALKKPALTGGALCLPLGCRGEGGAVTERWYREQARQIITARVETISRRADLTCRSVSINGAQKRWGSCGPQNTLNFSWRLVMAPQAVIDYVVVHELAHTRHHNHSGAFWATVRAIMPDYEEKKRWLTDHAGLLSQQFQPAGPDGKTHGGKVK